MSFTAIWQACRNRRVFAVLLLSFSSGLPLALSGSTLQAWYTVAGMNLLSIGALTLVGQPYVYKPLWAPILDRFVPLNIGRRRSWILWMQGSLAAVLAVMAFLTPQQHAWLLASCALLLAFFSATQDIAIDAYRADVLETNERGMGASFNTIGYRIAMIVSGAIALVLAGEWGWRVTYLIMSALMAGEMLITLWSPNPSHELPAPSTIQSAVVEPFKEFLTREKAIAIIVFILLYKLSDVFALSLNTTFLIRGVGFSLVDVGSVAKVVGLVAALVGSFIGGVLLPSLGLYRSLMYFGFLQMASNLSFAVLAVVGKSYAMMASAVFIEYFCGSLATVAFVVLLMGLCDKRYTATQYALLSALMGIPRVFVGPEAAMMVNHMGWLHFYVWTFFLGLPALFILWWLNHKIDFSAETLALPS